MWPLPYDVHQIREHLARAACWSLLCWVTVKIVGDCKADVRALLGHATAQCRVLDLVPSSVAWRVPWRGLGAGR